MRNLVQKTGRVYSSAGALQNSPWASTTGMATLFDSTLGADAASIDTGASGIASGHIALVVWILARTADAAAGGQLTVTVNNDTTAIYDTERVSGINATASAGPTNADTGWKTTTHGNTGSASYAGLWTIFIPAYDQTNFWKVGTMQAVIMDATAGNQVTSAFGLGYRATTAISRMTVTGSTANLKAGSRLLIMGAA